MKSIFKKVITPGWIFLLCFVLYGYIYCTPSEKKVETQNQDLTGIPAQFKKLVENIHWYGNAALKIVTGDKVLFFDPFELPEQDKADIIFITHSHFDHLSEGDLKKVAKPGTVFVTPNDQNCIAVIKKLFGQEPLILSPGQEKTVAGFNVKAVPAYNVVKKDRHPKAMGWVGYLVTTPEGIIYVAGDTERIPEMKTFTCDIAFLPLGQTYTMESVEDAAQAALDVKAKVVIPIHYGSFEGKVEDALKIKELLKGKIEVVIKNKE
jgi:L-ascorbate metabolism protein UlaG (beta-lactamase superfamily)